MDTLKGWPLGFIEVIKKEFAKGTKIEQLVIDYAGKIKKKILTSRIITSWLWTEEFQKKVVDAHHAGKLKYQKDIDDMFPNYCVKKSTVTSSWVPKFKKNQSVSFKSNPHQVDLKVKVTETFMRRVVALILDPTDFFTIKQILVKLEKDDNRPYSQSILEFCSRTLFFVHLLCPWACLYFLGVKGKSWIKVGRSRNHDKRVNTYETILIDETVIHLIVRYPINYELEVDRWFKATHAGHRILKLHYVKSSEKRDTSEFYNGTVLEMFKNSPDQTITLTLKKDGCTFQVTLEKLVPGSEEFKTFTTVLKFLRQLRNINPDESKNARKNDVECGFDPGIFNHPDIVGYPDRIRNSKIFQISKKPKMIN